MCVNKRRAQKAHLLCERKNPSHRFCVRISPCSSRATTAQHKQTKKISESYKCFKGDAKHAEIWEQKTQYGWIFNAAILASS